MAKKYDIDFLNNTVTLTASFLRKASVIGSAEYQEMLQLRRELPDYEFRKAETTKQKKTNKNATQDTVSRHTRDEFLRLFNLAYHKMVLLQTLVFYKKKKK